MVYVGHFSLSLSNRNFDVIIKSSFTKSATYICHLRNYEFFIDVKLNLFKLLKLNFYCVD